MKDENKEEILQASTYIVSLIQRCEKTQVKFQEGTSQHSLLKNRIHALQIANTLLTSANVVYDQDVLHQALLPIQSIIHKCTKAQAKYPIEHTQYNRYVPIIQAMQIAQAYVMQALGDAYDEDVD